MSLIHASLSPHPPLLIPNIGKENIDKVKKTVESLTKLNEELKEKKPDTIIIISPHGKINYEAFTINIDSDFKIKFEDFGDFETELNFKGDIGLAHLIQDKLKEDIPVHAIDEANLDHGCGVPLFYLAKELKNVKLIPIYFSGLSLGDHFTFGKLLAQEIDKSKKKIAVIASGDLSHCLSEEAPGGYSSKAAKFDNQLIEYVKNKKTHDIINMSEGLIEEAGECGLRSISILLGALDEKEYEAEILSYEFPFGVGYLTANFKL